MDIIMVTHCIRGEHNIRTCKVSVVYMGSTELYCIKNIKKTRILQSNITYFSKKFKQEAEMRENTLLFVF